MRLSAKRFSASDYAAAECFLPAKMLDTVRNATIVPNWIGSSDWFWYRRQSGDGESYVLYEASTGYGEEAFKIGVAANAAEEALGTKVDAKRLGVTRLEFGPDRTSVEITIAGAILSYDRSRDRCSARLDRPVGLGELLSPCRRFSVFCRDHNLWLLERATGAERQLTHDGEKNHGYGDLSDASLVAIPVAEGRLTLPPINVVWSPDSRYLVTVRVDERHVRAYPYLRSVPVDGASPKAYTLHRALIGDDAQPEARIVAIDVETGEVRPSHPAERVGLEADDDALGDGTCWFDSTNARCFIAQVRDRLQVARLIAVDLVTGERRTVIEEKVEGFVNLNLAIYNAPNVRVLGDGNEIVWFSERDGWGHLYLYAGDGTFKRQLTRGPWVVFDVICADETSRQLYFTGSSRDPAVNPYLRFLYRVSLDGGDPVLLTPEIADHVIDGVPQPMVILLYRRERPQCAVSPSGRYICAAYSTLSTPPVTVTRSTADGRIVSTVEEADNAALVATGYVPPEAFVAKAADGETDLHGVIYWPPHFDPSVKYPIVDALYNGFQVAVVPRNYVMGFFTTNPYGGRALAQLGFIVVTLDARGTALRSRAFHEHSFRNFGDAGIEDHVTVLEQLGARYPSFDVERVGASGYSFGGYYSTRLLLSRPGLFKAAVAGAGCHNWQGMYPGYENLIGEPRFSNGTSTSPDGVEIPENYLELDNAKLADRLQGKLLIFIGDLDENVPPAVNFQFVDALQKAGKDCELAVVWNATHWDSAIVPYVTRKTWDFFVRHLMGAEPPDWNAERR